MSVATDWLERVRVASRMIEELTRDVSALEYARDECVPWQTRGSGASVAAGGLHSDPTQRDALAREGLKEQIREARRQLDECESLVGDCLRLLSSVSRWVGPDASLALELYYVDRAHTWSEVADEMGMSRRTVCRERDQALAWLSLMGIEYAIRDASE